MEDAKIVNLIQLETPMIAAYFWDEDGHSTNIFQRIYYLGIMSNGGIVGISFIDGYIEIIDECANFFGLYDVREMQKDLYEQAMRYFEKEDAMNSGVTFQYLDEV